MTNELHLDFTVESCARCPMNYDGACDHPSLSEELNIYRRYDGLTPFDSPHPLCHLREMPLLLRVKS